MHEVCLPAGAGCEGGRIPVSGSSVVDEGHIGAAEGQATCTGADGEKLAGITAGGAGPMGGRKDSDGHEYEKESAVHGWQEHCTIPPGIRPL